MGKTIHDFPTMAQVNAGDHEQLCRWHRFLRTPKNDDELSIVNRNFDRLFTEFGGFTPEISKRIGW